MLPLETKQSGGKLLPHLDLRGGGVFLEEASCRRQRKRDILLGTWNVRSLYRAGSLTAAARELARYKLDLVGVREVRWDKGGTVRAGDYNFFGGKLHNEELKDLYSLPNILRVVKSRRMRWAGHVARVGGGESCAQCSGGETGG